MIKSGEQLGEIYRPIQTERRYSLTKNSLTEHVSPIANFKDKTLVFTKQLERYEDIKMDTIARKKV